MAASPSIETFNPRTLWTLLIGTATLLLIVGFATLLWTSSKQNQQLIAHEFNVLLRANTEKLERRNYRNFSEALGLNPDDYFLSVKDALTGSQMVYGNIPLLNKGQCTSETYFEHHLTFCRPLPIPWNIIAIATAVFAVLLGAALLSLNYFTHSMVSSFRALFSNAGIDHPSKLNFSQAWYMANHLANQFQIAKERAVQTEGQKLLAETASQVAHDIRGPLSALSIAVTKLPSEDPAVALIRAASLRIKDIADDVLQKRKVLQQKDSQIRISLPDLKTQLNDLIEEKRAMFPNAVLNLLSFDPRENLNIIAEKNWLIRIVSNILNNACESRDDEKTLVNIVVRATENRVEITISDNGPGMSTENIQKALSGGYSTKKFGNGLGLHAASNKISEWNGELRIESTVESGTHITMEIPTVST